MALDLMLTVLKHAPPLANAEFRLLMSIAQEARALDAPRDIDMGQLVVETQMTRSGLRKAFAAMSGRDMDVRVPVGVDKNGERLYAVPGRRPSYILRASWFLPPPVDGCTCARCKMARADPQGGTTVPPSRGDNSPSFFRREKRDRQAGETGRQTGETGQAGGTTLPPKTYVSPEGRETYVPSNPARSPSGTRVPPSAKAPHAYVADPEQGDWCHCGLAEKNKIHHHRRAAA